MRTIAVVSTVGLLTCLAGDRVHAEVVLENAAIRFVLDAKGRATSVLDRINNRELCARPAPAFGARVGKDWYGCTALTRTPEGIEVECDDLKLTAALAATVTPHYIVLQLRELRMPPVKPIDSFTLLSLALRPMGNFDRWLGVVYDDKYATILCAGDDFTRHTAELRDKIPIIRLTCEREVRQRGNRAVLIGCPTDKVLDYVDVMEADLSLPRGARHRRHPLQRRSYFWCSPTPENIEPYIAWAKTGGFGQITISYTAFTKSCGHYEFKPSYSNGIEDLKTVVGKIHEAGLAAGFHIHFNKAHLHDPYVSPVPDKRFHKYETLLVAKPFDAKAKRVVTHRQPRRCDVEPRRRLLHVGDELIRYESVSKDSPYGFAGCKRGALGTKAAAHPAGARISLLNVDTWPIFIRFDQWTDIQQETADRLAAMYNAAKFDFVYFDGSEDVHPPRWYFCPKAQWEVYRRLKPEPVVCEAAATTHFSWHMMTRSNAYDSVKAERMKSLCRRYPCRAAPGRARSFTRINFGWLSYHARSAQTIGVQPDVLEFICSRGAAYDCPLSLSASLERLEQNSRTEDNFEVLRNWEMGRLADFFTDDMKQQLRSRTQEHILLVNEGGQYELHPYWEIKGLFTERVPAPPKDEPKKGSFASRFEYEVMGEVRAFHFTRRGNIWAVYWHAFDEGSLELPLPADALRLYERIGVPALPVKAKGHSVIVPVGPRRYIEFLGLNREQVVDAFKRAKLIPRPVYAVYVQAEDAVRLVGKMCLGSSVGVRPDGAFGDVVVPTGASSPNAQEAWYAEYKIRVPRDGRYYVWSRVWYPDTSHNSFSLARAGEPNTGAKFGNAMRFREWFWDGGNALRLEAGEERVWVYEREGSNDPRRSPRLDLLCIVDSHGYVPTDEAARGALKTRANDVHP